MSKEGRQRILSYLALPILLPFFFLALLFLTIWLVDMVLIFLALILCTWKWPPDSTRRPPHFFPAPPKGQSNLASGSQIHPAWTELDRAICFISRENDMDTVWRRGGGCTYREWAVQYSRPRPCLTHLFSPNGNNLVHIKRLCGTVGGEGGRQYELQGIRRCESY